MESPEYMDRYKKLLRRWKSASKAEVGAVEVGVRNPKQFSHPHCDPNRLRAQFAAASLTSSVERYDVRLRVWNLPMPFAHRH